ncbi:MAG: aspartate/glutamate racemase family protein [Gammaproteobacteria bacterium]|nr:aspartate/glutamate racemase family protein [Gammaproteobacteria bacterium]MDH4254502.1 aspartate/glutamate racemase family protein [Gammaproteobacteria bacterium]MDH5309106.1 aspartate/glutamate racemase family protein [Gammaproteobacteria bacterium]
MKTIGLIGGMSWESTAGYYRAINEGVKRELGGLHSAQIALYSVDFQPIEQLQHAGDWDGTATILVDAARRVQGAGAEFLLICTNTMHRVAPQVEAAVSIPLLHIADATGEALVADGLRRVGLLGTAFTMEQEFYKGRLAERFGLDVLVPEAADRAVVHRVIYDELCLGRVESASRSGYLDIIDRLAQRGAEAVILGCTEIGLLVKQADTTVKLYDTTAIHAECAVALALEGRRAGEG